MTEEQRRETIESPEAYPVKFDTVSIWYTWELCGRAGFVEIAEEACVRECRRAIAAINKKRQQEGAEPL